VSLNILVQLPSIPEAFSLAKVIPSLTATAVSALSITHQHLPFPGGPVASCFELLDRVQELSWAGGVVEHLPSKCKALNSNPSTAKKKKRSRAFSGGRSMLSCHKE
jgi:hypothetical protein